jgi:transcriptional regulator with XRE-family HTH domain
MRYHYGQTIREYREKRNISIARLADMWPSKEDGVTSRYVSDIERGKKHISDVGVLRELARILDIPLWKFGLSEYDPFKEMKDGLLQTSDLKENFSLIESLIQQIWTTKVASGINVDNHILMLSRHFHYLLEKYHPGLFDDVDFLCLYAQVKRLQAVRAYDDRHYEQALAYFREMKALAERSNNSVSLALSHMAIGVESMRAGNLDVALAYLHKAHDFTFKTGKEVASLVSGMLARCYASKGDRYHFEKYGNHAVMVGQVLGNSRLNMTDYVFTSLSGLMEEISNGYILLNHGAKALEYLPQIERQLASEGNLYLDMWLPLDYAQAYLCLGEVMESLHYLQLFYEKTRLMRTRHIESRMAEHIHAIEKLGYGNLPEMAQVKDIFNEIIQRTSGAERKTG